MNAGSGRTPSLRTPMPISQAQPVEDDALAGEDRAPASSEEDGGRTDTVVLACTHYPLLTERLARLAPLAGRLARPGTPAIARRKS